MILSESLYPNRNLVILVTSNTLRSPYSGADYTYFTGKVVHSNWSMYYAGVTRGDWPADSFYQINIRELKKRGFLNAPAKM